MLCENGKSIKIMDAGLVAVQIRDCVFRLAGIYGFKGIGAC